MWTAALFTITHTRGSWTRTRVSVKVAPECCRSSCWLRYRKGIWRSTISSDILEQLHWLPIEWRIKFKISCITYKTVSTIQPAYLHSLTETLCSISYFMLFWLQFIICPLCPHKFWVSQFFCSCSYHLEFPSLGYSKQSYHILFSPPTQNLLLQSSFSVSLVPYPTPAQCLKFGRSTANIVRFTNSFTYLLT